MLKNLPPSIINHNNNTPLTFDLGKHGWGSQIIECCQIPKYPPRIRSLGSGSKPTRKLTIDPVGTPVCKNPRVRSFPLTKLIPFTNWQTVTNKQALSSRRKNRKQVHQSRLAVWKRLQPLIDLRKYWPPAWKIITHISDEIHFTQPTDYSANIPLNHLRFSR